MSILRDGWESYEKEVVPPNAGTVQKNETRAAFYAGAACVFYGIINTLEDTGDDEPTEADEKIVDRVDLRIALLLVQELREFIQSHAPR